MYEILTVCTGNVCRSPLAALLLRARLAPAEPRILSAGTRGLRAAPMTEEAIELATGRGVREADAVAHRSRFLTERDLISADLILTMTRDHRREVAELAPSRLRSTFTFREFARIRAEVPDDVIRDAAAAGADAAERVRAMSAAVATYRGLVVQARDPADDDVVDPFGRSWGTYELSAEQLDPAIEAVIRALRIATEDA